MNNNSDGRAERALTRSAYAKRFAACQAILFVYGFIIGSIIPDFGQPGALGTFIALVILGNVIVGSFFVSFTYRRALDCEFGQNGKAWIAAVAAAPTLFFGGLAFIVFAVMMFFKSAPDEEELLEFENDEFPLPPLQAGE